MEDWLSKAQVNQLWSVLNSVAQPESISDVRIESANDLLLFNETAFQISWDP